MIKSMTGFGRSQLNENGYAISCEMKGVNHRYFDPHIRMPRRYGLLEDKVKEEMKKHIQRGRIELSINIEKTGESTRNIKVDKELAMAYYNSLKDLAKNLDMHANFSLIDIFRLPDVFSLEEAEEDLEITWQTLQKSLAEAIDGLMDMRIREGRNLLTDLLARTDFILNEVSTLEKRAPLLEQEYEEKLRTKIKEMIPQDTVDENRILQEVAIFADRVSITEEIVRLQSHIQQLNETLMNSEEAIGRKSDFLVQEMFREINTVASKANDIEIGQIVIRVKAELEKIREQIQNIE
ncbi:MAG: YicC family protein [Syntrophomonadaceae bacterium]|nr:YicC family protein [Syntrophomonadaceae bacterium]